MKVEGWGNLWRIFCFKNVSLWVSFIYFKVTYVLPTEKSIILILASSWPWIKCWLFWCQKSQPRKDVQCTCPVKVSLSSCTKDIHYMAGEAWGGCGIPQLQISAAKYEAPWCPPTPPTPQICAHQKPKNWRCTHCSVYCQGSQKNLTTGNVIYQKFSLSVFSCLDYEENARSRSLGTDQWANIRIGLKHSSPFEWQ